MRSGTAIAICIFVVALPGSAMALETSGNAVAGTYEATPVGKMVPASIEDFCTFSSNFYLHADRKVPGPNAEPQRFTVSAWRRDEGFTALIHPGPQIVNKQEIALLMGEFFLTPQPCGSATGLRPMRGLAVEGLDITNEGAEDVNMEFKPAPQ